MSAPPPIHALLAAVEALIARLGLAPLARRSMAVIAVVPRATGSSLLHCRAVALYGATAARLERVLADADEREIACLLDDVAEFMLESLA